MGAGLLLAAGGLSLAELGIEAPSSEPKAAAAEDGVGRVLCLGGRFVVGRRERLVR